MTRVVSNVYKHRDSMFKHSVQNLRRLTKEHRTFLYLRVFN